MNISTIKLAFKYLTGGISGVVEYLLGALNTALGSIGEASKEKIQAALNIARKVLSSLEAFQWLCPTKWQTAYKVTLDAVASCADALSDLEITKVELDVVTDKVTDAIRAWRGEDDATCADADTLKI